MTSPTLETGQIDLLYDGHCPICKTEVLFLKKWDVEGRIRFTDISLPSYDPSQHGGVTFEDGMSKLRAGEGGGRRKRESKGTI